jgi:hypothetical protein
LGTYSALVIVYRFFEERTIPKRFVTLVSLVIVAVGILGFNTVRATNITGPTYTMDQVIHMSEFGPEGVLKLLHEHWWDYLLEIFQLDHGMAGVIWLVFLAAAFYVAGIGRDRELIRAEIILIPVSAVINYAVVYIVLVRLYEPGRYIMFPSHILTLCCVPFLFKYGLNLFGPWFNRIDGWMTANRHVWSGAFIIITIVGAGVFAARVHYNRGGADTMPSEIYTFLGTLPKDTLIAATPMDGDRVPMRSHRSVLLIGVSIVPYHPRFYDEMKERFLLMLAAQYDSDPKAVQYLRKKYGIRYFVLNKNYSRPDPIEEYQPFKDYLVDFRSKIGEKPPFILSLLNDATVFQKGDYSVLDLDRLGPLARDQDDRK